MIRGGSISRRAFLRNGGGLALMGAVPAPLTHLLAISPKSSLTHPAAVPPKASLTRSTFMPLLGSRFRMTGRGAGLDVVLAEINDLATSRGAADDHRFALVFRAPAGSPRLQGTQTFRHGRIGGVALFVTAIDRGIGSTRYEAVINNP
jgi:hypothetical protein